MYSDWPVDGGDGMGNWRSWKIESQVAPWNNYPIIATMGAASLEYIFSTPPVPVEGTNDKLIDALKLRFRQGRAEDLRQGRHVHRVCDGLHGAAAMSTIRR